MSSLLTKSRTALALGVPNIVRVAGYRLGVRLGLNPVRRLQASVPAGPFFGPPAISPLPVPPVSGWKGSGLMFSRWPVTVGDEPPDWHANPLTGQCIPNPERPWWRIADFDPAVGDIKLVWELSRMDWAVALAQQARQGDASALTRLNAWLIDWCQQNPPYLGPNWKCGQEASIRVMHLACVALILGHSARDVSSGTKELLALHLQRIAPTVQYAMAQDNNHGTSEAAALFIGGCWLAALGGGEGTRWQQVGRRWIEDRAARLIGPQGSFSQYSLNYHRLMLDTFSLTEIWRRKLDQPPFSIQCREQVRTAAQWLRHMVNDGNGDGPNVGANDGAYLLQLSDAPYRDYRPSIQLAMVLFGGQRAYAQGGPWNRTLEWLDVPLPRDQAEPPGDWEADDGGFAVMRRGSAMAMLRYPRFRFRPSQADALHLDLWLGQGNLLRDAGTYSYNTDPRWLDYFGGTAGHNTVQFDGCDQMPRLSRFLFGDWLRTRWLDRMTRGERSTRFAAGYLDTRGASHKRVVELGDAYLRVEDEVAGFVRSAVLRWRLPPGAWQLDGVSNRFFLKQTNAAMPTLLVDSNVPITRCELVSGWESLHYMEKTSVPVLEVEIMQPGTLTTKVHWEV